MMQLVVHIAHLSKRKLNMHITCSIVVTFELFELYYWLELYEFYCKRNKVHKVHKVNKSRS